MRGLWARLLRGGGRSARLEVGLPLVAGGVITVVLLLLLGLQQGLDHRADRTEWRTPEATTTPSMVQAGSIDYVGERPIAIIELAALTEDPPDVPGMNRFPEPGEVWASPALALLIEEQPADQLADRFPGPVTAELDDSLLEGPDELVAVIGRAPTDSSMTGERPEHQWNPAASLTPTTTDRWSTTADIYQTTYGDIALLVVVLTALPLVGLGGLASRLMARRRQRRIATLRLLGASTSQVVRLTITELATFTSIGAVCGVALHRLVLPIAARVQIKGGAWFPADVRPSAALTLATAAAVVGMLTLGALTGLVPAVRDPLGTYRRARRDAEHPRLWSIVFIGAAIALFWLRSSNPFVTIAFTAVVILGWGLVATGPWIIAGLGRLLATRARHPATFLAGRRLSNDPKGAWRPVGGMVLASFIAGFVAASLPIAIGNAAAYDTRAGRLDLVVPAASLDTAVHETDALLRAADIPADVKPTAAPDWLDQSKWGTLTVAINGPDTDLDRARTALSEHDHSGPELRLSDDLPIVWLLRDGLVVSLLVLPIAALVALTAMVIGTIARIFDQRDTLIALTLAGTPQSFLLAAQRREMILPTILLGGIAAVAGLASGATLGSTSLLNPYSTGTFAALLALGSLALVLADRTAQPVLQRARTDLSERE